MSRGIFIPIASQRAPRLPFNYARNCPESIQQIEFLANSGHYFEKLNPTCSRDDNRAEGLHEKGPLGGPFVTVVAFKACRET